MAQWYGGYVFGLKMLAVQNPLLHHFESEAVVALPAAIPKASSSDIICVGKNTSSLKV